ncbi:acyl-CoA dehydrogenase N-terminal domain-containing protein [Acinetobacter johnsonii]
MHQYKAPIRDMQFVLHETSVINQKTYNLFDLKLISKII